MDLEIWQLSRQLASEIYKVTEHFPSRENFGITSQLRRAAVSVPSNIAEGHSRSGTRDFMRFLSISIGSLAELETQLIISSDIGFLKEDKLEPLIQKIHRIQKMTYSMHKKLGSKNV